MLVGDDYGQKHGADRRPLDFGGSSVATEDRSPVYGCRGHTAGIGSHGDAVGRA
jgi:hypothetical protein